MAQTTAIAFETGLPVWIAEEPLACVAMGVGEALQAIGRLKGGLKLSRRASGGARRRARRSPRRPVRYGTQCRNVQYCGVV